jgi:amino acid permease-like protein
VPFIRSIGKWTLTALVINAIIGSGIFGLPSELTRLLGHASPLAMLAAAFAMATMILCMAEVASQFSEAGGPYLYIRAAFGRFSSIQNRMVPLAGGNRRGRSQCSPFCVLSGCVSALGGAWLEPRIATVHPDRDSHCRKLCGSSQRGTLEHPVDFAKAVATGTDHRVGSHPVQSSC